MLDSRVLLIDTASASFTIKAIRNRRFMFSPDTGELILGRQYKGIKLHASHAAEHEETGTVTPFDSFVRGWVGTGKGYKYGIIHFARLSMYGIRSNLIGHTPHFRCSRHMEQQTKQLFGALAKSGNNHWRGY